MNETVGHVAAELAKEAMGRLSALAHKNRKETWEDFLPILRKDVSAFLIERFPDLDQTFVDDVVVTNVDVTYARVNIDFEAIAVAVLHYDPTSPTYHDTTPPGALS